MLGKNPEYVYVKYWCYVSYDIWEISTIAVDLDIKIRYIYEKYSETPPFIFLK